MQVILGSDGGVGAVGVCVREGCVCEGGVCVKGGLIGKELHVTNGTHAENI